MHTIGRTATAMLVTAVSCTASLHAQETTSGYRLTEADGEFADVLFELQEAVVNRGLVIDFEGHVGDMLSRTADVVGTPSPFAQAEYFQFCSAALTHAAVAASPDNLAICPYVVFAYTTASAPDVVMVGYRRPAGGTDPASLEALGAIDELLQGIVDEVSASP